MRAEKSTRRKLVGALTALVLAPAFADTPLPLGDGKVASQPMVGYVYRCGHSGTGDGPRVSGPWIQGQTWYPDQKPSVAGNVSWPNSRLSIDVTGAERVISTNALPNHSTGMFPIQASDPVYRYDRNPNSIKEQNVLMRVPTQPTEASIPSCLTPGPIGYLLTGAALFDALDAASLDAPAHEVQDRCNGHPERRGQYHYHNASRCLTDAAGQQGRHSDLIGYAADGFGIYGLKGENGLELTNDDLDACHGHTHTIAWDGKATRMYHYHFTRTFPYSLGCFKGTPIARDARAENGERERDGMRRDQRTPREFRPPPPGGPRPFGGPPPQR